MLAVAVWITTQCCYSYSNAIIHGCMHVSRTRLTKQAYTKGLHTDITVLNNKPRARMHATRDSMTTVILVTCGDLHLHHMAGGAAGAV